MKPFQLLLTALVCLAAQAQAQTAVFDLWPQGAPTASSDPTDTARITVSLPPQNKATGQAVIVCPGGGYQGLAWDYEGTDWAPYFNRLGIAAIILKYRMPHGQHTIPREDAEQTIRLARQMADKWHIDPHKIGIMGFSAGGHLAATCATISDADVRPDFHILFYPCTTMEVGKVHPLVHENFFGQTKSKKLDRLYSPDINVTRNTPPAFIAVADDDSMVMPTNSVEYYLQCLRHDIPAALMVYPTGEHGFGMHNSFDYHEDLLSTLRQWLAQLNAKKRQ